MYNFTSDWATFTHHTAHASPVAAGAAFGEQRSAGEPRLSVREEWASDRMRDGKCDLGPQWAVKLKLTIIISENLPRVKKCKTFGSQSWVYWFRWVWESWKENSQWKAWCMAQVIHVGATALPPTQPCPWELSPATLRRPRGDLSHLNARFLWFHCVMTLGSP